MDSPGANPDKTGFFRGFTPKKSRFIRICPRILLKMGPRMGKYGTNNKKNQGVPIKKNIFPKKNQGVPLKKTFS